MTPRLGRTALPLLLPLLALAACRAGPDPGSGSFPAGDDRRIHWQRTLDDAEQLARATGRPLLLALNMDGESASDRIWHENYQDPRFVALTRRCVCVAASVFRHNPSDHDERGRRIPCPRLAGLTCGEHVALEPLLFERFLPDGQRVAPRHVLIRAGGEVAMDVALAFDLADIDRALAAATAGIEPWAIPPGGDWAALAARRDAIGRQALEQQLAAAADPATLREALAALGAHGDAGARDALRIVAARLPDAPLDALQAAAAQLGLESELMAILCDGAQRLGGTPWDLTPSPARDAVLGAVFGPQADRRMRLWLVGLAASCDEDDDAVRCAVERAFGEDGWPEAPPPVSIAAVLAAGAAAQEPGELLPRPVAPPRELGAAETLRGHLQALDERLAAAPDDAEALAAAGVASLDLGRVEIDAGGTLAVLLFEDAANYLRRALDRQPDRFEWWLERARAEFLLGRFTAQRTCGLRALELAGYTWPAPAAVWPQLLQDRRAWEAVRWIGDADARLVAAAEPGAALVPGARSALLGLGLGAASPFAVGRDLAGFASFAGLLGLLREELAIAVGGAGRLPHDAEAHAALATALWGTDRWTLLPAFIHAALHSPPTAATHWWIGYAHVLVAEQLRRGEQPQTAAAHYLYAERQFNACAALSPDTNAAAMVALTWLGRGLAAAQGAAADRERAAACLVRAAAGGVDLEPIRDGLGYDCLDLVDKVLEWRVGGPSPVDPLLLLDELAAVAGEHAAFWAAAIGDSALREALRADGRNPERVIADTVDAEGLPMRAFVGLPTGLGDRYLDVAVAAGERAGGEHADVLCQALLCVAERQLVRGRTDGVAAALGRAAVLLGIDQEPLASAAPAALQAAAARLRAELGPARPRWREGR